jgi:hypothetical protein
VRKAGCRLSEALQQKFRRTQLESRLLSKCRLTCEEKAKHSLRCSLPDWQGYEASVRLDFGGSRAPLFFFGPRPTS